MLTLYLFIVVKDESYFKLKGTIFLVVIVVRKIPVFSERKMDTSGCEQQWIHIAALRLPEENFYVTNVFKLVSLAIPKKQFLTT